MRHSILNNHAEGIHEGKHLMDSVTNFIKNYIITMRPYLLFVSGITGIAGLSLGEGLSGIQLIALSIAFFLTYGFGQALTDCFQTDTDSISSPYRPLVQGKLSRKAVMITSLAGLTIAGTVIIYFNILNFALALTATLGLATYTYFKRRWWGGPFYNAWIVGVVFIMGVLSQPVHIPVRSAVFYGTLATVFFGYANFVLTGYYKDISADAKTGYNTLVVKFGMKFSAYVSDIFALLQLAGYILAVVLLYNPDNWYPVVSVAAGITGIIFLITGQIFIHKVKNEAEAYKSISPVVHAYILLPASIVCLSKPEWSLWIIIFYAGYILTLKLRPEKSQI
jgi:4-hydroxybenzoate polyprenyltransferase